MDTTDFFATYVPDLTEVSEADALRVRGELETFLRKGWPDLDTAPNTPFGDLHLTPLAYLLAGMEVGLRRFMSDLDLENPAKGIIYNCDFVRRFLGNYGVYARDTLRSTGIARLVFNADTQVTLDRSTRISFGTGTSQSVFNLRMPQPGGWIIRQVGSPLTPTTNNVSLISVGDGTYYADVPVIGDLNADVTAGDAGSITPVPATLVSIRALATFDKGAPADSIPVLADRARQTIYSSSMGSRGSARRFLLKEFPDLVAASVTVSGDTEMMRDTTNPLGIADGRADMYVRSSAAGTPDQFVLEALYDEDLNSYWVKLPNNGHIQSVTGVLYNGTVSAARPDYTIYSVSSDHQRATMAAAAYSRLEQLYVVLNNIKDPATGNELIKYQITAEGNRVTPLTVTVLTDPMVPIIASTLESSDSAPIGVDVLVRGFLPVQLQSFNVRYAKKAGSTMFLDKARAEILGYVNSLGHPNQYSDSRIGDALFYAGASDVLGTDVRGAVRWSAADYFLSSDFPSFETNAADIADYAYMPATVTITDSRSMRPTVRDPDLTTLTSSGPRNLTYYLADANLTFSEEYDV